MLRQSFADHLKTHWRLYGAAIALVHCTAACSSPSNEAGRPLNEDTAEAGSATDAPNADPASAETLIVALGDSLYAGYGIGAEASLPDDLEEALRANGVDAAVVNAGVSGDTTAAGQARLDYVLDGLPRTPDLIVLGLGGNDVLRGLPPGEARANLTAMMDTLQARGVPVVLTGMQAAPNLGADYARDFNSIYRDLAARYDAALYPFLLDGVITDPTLMLDDGIHPTAEGIDRIIERLAPVVQAKLSEH